MRRTSKACVTGRFVRKFCELHYKFLRIGEYPEYGYSQYETECLGHRHSLGHIVLKYVE